MSISQPNNIITPSNNNPLSPTKQHETNKAKRDQYVLYASVCIAGMCMGYFAYTLGAGIFALFFGLVWAVLIYQFDSQLIAHIDKTPHIAYEKEKSDNLFLNIFKRLQVTFLAFTQGGNLFRIILATALAFFTSFPLELLIFKKEVQKEIQIILQQDKSAFNDALTARLKPIEEKIKTLEQQKESALADIQARITKKDNELTSISNVDITPNYYKRYSATKRIEADIKQLEQEKTNTETKFNDKIELLTNELAIEKAKIDEAQNQYNNTSAQLSEGFLIEQRALNSLIKKEPAFYFLRWLIALILISLELLPLLVKILAKPTTEEVERYEEAEEKKKKLAKIEAEEKLQAEEKQMAEPRRKEAMETILNAESASRIKQAQDKINSDEKNAQKENEANELRVDTFTKQENSAYNAILKKLEKDREKLDSKLASEKKLYNEALKEEEKTKQLQKKLMEETKQLQIQQVEEAKRLQDQLQAENDIIRINNEAREEKIRLLNEQKQLDEQLSKIKR